MKPKVSIVTSVYDGEQEIELTVDSILNQTHEDFEYVIVDDGSKDDTQHILRKYAARDRRIIIIRNDCNLGLTVSLNKGIDQAKGTYILRIDSGDIAAFDRTERQLVFMTHHADVGIVGSNDIVIFPDLGTYRVSHRPNEDNSITRSLMHRNCFSHSTLMIRRDVFRRIGYYRTKYAQDYDLILRTKQHYKLANIAQCLCIRTQKSDSITAKYWRNQESIAMRSKMRYHARLDADGFARVLAWMYLPSNLMRLCIPLKLKIVYNRYRSLPLPEGFDYADLDCYYRLLDSVNRP